MAEFLPAHQQLYFLRVVGLAVFNPFVSTICLELSTCCHYSEK
jgi:hypothetical protein